MTIKGRLQVRVLPLGGFRAKISKSRRNVAQNDGFWGNGGLNVKLWFQNPQKAHPCAELHHLTYFA